MTTDFIDGSLFADADNINIDNENRVLGRDRGEARIHRRDRLGGVVHEYVLAA